MIVTVVATVVMIVVDAVGYGAGSPRLCPAPATMMLSRTRPAGPALGWMNGCRADPGNSTNLLAVGENVGSVAAGTAAATM